MKPIQAFFWDYDNTLLETAAAHWKKHQVVLSRYEIELSDKYQKRIYENNGHQNWEWMHKELGLNVSISDYLREIDEIFREQMLTLQMRPGIAELLKMIHDLNIPQAIVTNARRSSAEPILSKKKIISFMKFVLYKEDYSGRKPDPAPYLAAFDKMAEILGTPIAPKKCLAVEDDPLGVESAHLAGALVIHRKLNQNDPETPFADYSCFHEADFVAIIKSLLQQDL